MRSSFPPSKASAKPLDTVYEVETPEGVEFRLRAAGPVVRGLAWAIDTLIRLAVYIGMSVVLSLLGKFGLGLLLIMLFLVEWFYPVVFEIYYHGATPGKRAFGLCVVNDNGTPVGWAGSMTRNLLRFVDFLPALYGFGLLSLCIGKESKRLGDLAAGTRVVYRDREKQASPVQQIKGVPPLVPLRIDEQRAIVDFSTRLPQFSEARAQELAAIVAPWVARPARNATAALAGVANWLLGK